MNHLSTHLFRCLLLISLGAGVVLWWKAILFLSQRDYVSGLVLCLTGVFAALLGREFGILSMFSSAKDNQE